MDVSIPLSVDTLAWTSTVPPQTGVETTDLVLRKRQEEVIRSSHLISHTYVKVRDKGGDKIWATPYIFEHKICAHTWTHWVANNSHKSGCNLSPSASRYGYATELRIHTLCGEGVHSFNSCYPPRPHVQIMACLTPHWKIMPHRLDQLEPPRGMRRNQHASIYGPWEYPNISMLEGNWHPIAWTHANTTW